MSGLDPRVITVFGGPAFWISTVPSLAVTLKVSHGSGVLMMSRHHARPPDKKRQKVQDSWLFS